MSDTTTETQLARVRAAVACLDAGDTEGFLDFWSDDVVYQISGHAPLSGAYYGRNQVRTMVDRFLRVMNESVRLEPVDLLADERHIAILFHTTGERDGKTLDVMTANFMTVGEDGKWTHCWFVPSDQRAWDAFFS